MNGWRTRSKRSMTTSELHNFCICFLRWLQLFLSDYLSFSLMAVCFKHSLESIVLVESIAFAASSCMWNAGKWDLSLAFADFDATQGHDSIWMHSSSWPSLFYTCHSPAIFAGGVANWVRSCLWAKTMSWSTSSSSTQKKWRITDLRCVW